MLNERNAEPSRPQTPEGFKITSTARDGDSGGQLVEATMPFSNELIGDADKARVDWSKFKAWSFSKPLRPWKWTIDRERDVFLVRLEGRGPDAERPETYALWWKGDVIRFEAVVTSRGDFKTGVDVVWDVNKIDVPTHLAASRQEILRVLTEAIQVYGIAYGEAHIKSMRVNVR